MPLLVPLIVGAAVVLAAFKGNAAVKKSWHAAAIELEMEVEIGNGTKPEIRGSMDGVSVQVRVVKKGDNHFTEYQVTHTPVGPPVKIKRQGPLAQVSKWFGRRDIEVGTPHFDDKVIVDSGVPEQVRAFLTPSRQAAVLAIFDRWSRAEITHNKIQVSTLKVQRSAAEIVDSVRQLVAIAQVMGHPAELDAALGMRQHGDLGQAIDELHEINERNPNEFTQMLEAEALIEHGEHERASEILVPGLGSADTAAQGWERLASTPSPVVLPAPAAEAVVSDIGQQPVIDDLFGGQLMSFEVVERFEQQYLNKRVGWSGTVTQMNTYRHDHDFGEGPGVKAALLLGTAGGSAVISNEVHAVVQFGADVQLERGAEVTFVATLLHVDRFARKIYLSTGVLT